jgi:LPXTG-motif cell wall-anchored protein
LHVVATNVPAARLVRVLVRATPAQLNPSGGVTFVNSAQVTHVFPNSTVDTDNITARRRTALVGGDANGVQAPATTTTTAPAVTTTTVAGVPVSPAPTTTNAAVLPPVPPTFPTPAPGEELPATGSNGTLLLAGLVTFLAGVSLLVVATRRRPTA